ncbi:MAG: sigma-70 family RNA polymerase sigma factor [Armatimonas sp.]
MITSHQRFEALVREHESFLRRNALALCQGCLHDADDLLSETMLDGLRAFPGFKNGSFRRWMIRLMTTNRIDMARRARVRQSDSLEMLMDGESGFDVADSSPSVERQALGNLLSVELRSAIAALPKDFRTALVLSDVEGYGYEDIASTLDVPLGTVRSRIHRARHKVRTSLEKRGIAA